MNKRILTMFWYDDISEVHLYKDVGGIPYALAKYCGWEATFAYSDINGIIKNSDFEKYVDLKTIHYSRTCSKLKLKIIKYCNVMKFVWQNAARYDVINFYHTHKFIMFLCWLAKKRNPVIKTYVKMDMGRDGFEKTINHARTGKKKWWHHFTTSVDLFTVEAEKYALELTEKVKKYKNVQYLPNGFFADFLPVGDQISKERIILTVGRIGTYQKNTELLINTLLQIPKEKLTGWSVYIVGPIEKDFFKWYEKITYSNLWLREHIVFTGNITDKGKLHEIYSKSSVFVLSSRYEGFPLVVPEEMYFKNYLISTDCFGAADEIIKSDISGFGRIVPGEDINSLKEALEEVLDGKVDLTVQGANAGAFAIENLDWRVIAKKLECYLQNLS